MKNLRIVFALLVFSLCSVMNYAQSDLSGAWDMGEQNTVLKMELENDIYIGTIISSDNPKVDIGKLIVKDVKQNKGIWQGKLYAVKKDNWMDAEFSPENDKLSVKVKAGFMSKTLMWTKE